MCIVFEFVIILNLHLIMCFNVQNHVIQQESGAISTNLWSVKINLQPGENLNALHNKADVIAASIGMKSLGQIGELIGHYVFALNHTTNIRDFTPYHSEIEWHQQEEILKRDKRVPVRKKNIEEQSNKLTFKDPLYHNQWHLHNRQGIDCNVTGVWKNGIAGFGVVVAVVDDGVQWKHPDLKSNYCPEGSFDLNSDDDDPSPEPDDKGENKHGTRCAGEIAAVPNDVCGVGIAYKSKFSGIRILDGPMTDSIEAIAFNKHMDVNDIYSCSWGPEDDGKTVDGPRALARAALQHGVVAGRSGFGSIFIVASGNGGSKGDNCNYDGYANSIYTITIAAVDEYGILPSYAEQCTSMLACTVSSASFPSPGRSITTTDWTFNHNNKKCTNDHTGTSAATPLVAGMVALMLETRPCLSWRDVQHIIVMTATPLYEVTLNHDKSWWKSNAAGFAHNNSHGFGLLDSWKLVNAAKTWRQVPWLTSLEPSCPMTSGAIPNDGSGYLKLETTVTKEECNRHLLNTLEHVLITVTLNHPSRGNLQFIFICPSGTRSEIPRRTKDTSSDGLTEWIFSTVRCWGESSHGKYQLLVQDRNNQKNYSPGVLHKWQITLYGSQMTSSDILHRKMTIQEALSGGFISLDSNFSLACPPGQPLSFDITKALSEKTLKLVVLLSCFFVFWGAYYTLEMAFCNAEDKQQTELSDQPATSESEPIASSSDNQSGNEVRHTDSIPMQEFGYGSVNSPQASSVCGNGSNS